MRAVPKDMILGQVRAALRPSHLDAVEVREVLLAALSLGHDPMALYLDAITSRLPEYEPAPPIPKVLPEAVIRYLMEREDQSESEFTDETELEELGRATEDDEILDRAVSRGEEQPLAEMARTAARSDGEPRTLTGLFIDQLVIRREGQWISAAERGLPVGSGRARVIDLEGDAAALTLSLADAANPVADALERATLDIAETLSVPGRFGGFTVSPQLEGFWLQDSIYINILYAWHRATEEIAKAMSDPLRATRRWVAPGLLDTLTRRDAQIYKTAQNVVDVLIHEIVHREARHDAATGRQDFITAYSQALRALVPTYAHLIRPVRDAIERVADRMDSLAVVYRQGLDRSSGTTDR